MKVEFVAAYLYIALGALVVKGQFFCEVALGKQFVVDFDFRLHSHFLLNKLAEARKVDLLPRKHCAIAPLQVEHPYFYYQITTTESNKGKKCYSVCHLPFDYLLPSLVTCIQNKIIFSQEHFGFHFLVSGCPP